ncbi:MAG: tetratricopeptide repeat protein [Candidatus Latescibacteria bacterium]|nr:tetratricopeptide repeat protein [Candidatus Latescibacterota bacterium]
MHQCDIPPGTGRADRFPYTSFSEWLDPEPLDELMEVLEEAVDDPEGQRQMMRAYANQHPAVFEVARWLLWHGEDPASAIYLLSSLGTERAVVELKRFALGQAGEDEERMRAAKELNDQGQFPEGQPVRLWHKGEWRDLLLKTFAITDEPEEIEYRPEVRRLLGEAAVAAQEKRLDQPEAMCHRILEQDPGCRMADTVLANICSHRGDTPGMARQFEKALEIDPDYATARCGLALLYLEAGKVEEAEEFIAPLLGRQKFARSELIAYNVAMARIQLHRGNVEAVEAALDVLFELAPDDPLVLQLEQTLGGHREKG